MSNGLTFRSRVRDRSLKLRRALAGDADLVPSQTEVAEFDNKILFAVKLIISQMRIFISILKLLIIII